MFVRNTNSPENFEIIENLSNHNKHIAIENTEEENRIKTNPGNSKYDIETEYVKEAENQESEEIKDSSSKKKRFVKKLLFAIIINLGIFISFVIYSILFEKKIMSCGHLKAFHIICFITYLMALFISFKKYFTAFKTIFNCFSLVLFLCYNAAMIIGYIVCTSNKTKKSNG
ncbi:hypothetical protein EDEG_01616 [Edhazardia aedis USNM 41457]|uniref:Uncharacterized protein n=1 Tax=Edhazardia aedis (strain USNM 41457) TaxID=1003232 RepID=J9D9D5_EDHAE|nr:hypothetical protein EDEG_01616 [Edhazardia aedis USNM 41457]|eukprot:EJW04094.1 hypothetical protein EDEG_01616 [Edhazardia aedis USNM 41457]